MITIAVFPTPSSLSLPPFLSLLSFQAFSKKCIERRKEWLTQWLQHRREKREQGHNESLLYAERMEHISYSDFVNKELILFSNMDNERSIACSVDGEMLHLTETCVLSNVLRSHTYLGILRTCALHVECMVRVRLESPMLSGATGVYMAH